MKSLKRGRLRKRLPKKFWIVLYSLFIIFSIIFWVSIIYIKSNLADDIQHEEFIIPTPMPTPVVTPTPLPLPDNPKDLILDMIPYSITHRSPLYDWMPHYPIEDIIEEPKYDNNGPEAEYVDLYPQIPLDNKVEFYIYEKCKEYGLRFKVVLGLIYAESEFDHMCRDNKNTNGTYDVGLFQINSNNFEWMERVFGKEWDEYMLYDNIDAGLYILNYAQSVTDNEHGMLMVYNMGENGAKKKWAEGILTTDYSKKVMYFANSLPDLNFE